VLTRWDSIGIQKVLHGGSNKKSTDDYESAFEGVGFYLVTMRRKSSSDPKGRVQ